MQYLVLSRFNSFGNLLEKGTVVDESAIRSPRLRCSEGKIIPAVSSLEIPVESEVVETEDSTIKPAPSGTLRDKLHW